MNPIIYKQLDSKWSRLPYPTKKSTFGGNGCGCCACTHAALEMPDKANWTPENLRQWMINQGFVVAGNGTTWQGIVSTLEYLGYKNVVWVKNNDPMSKAWAEFDKGNRIAVLLVSNGKTPDGTYWTSSGHYVFAGEYKVENGLHWFNIKDSGGRGHDGWFCYEKSIKGALPQLYIAERVGEPLPEPEPRKGLYTGAYPNPKKYLEFGDKGTEVAKLQEYLNWAFEGKKEFAPLAVDGKYGNDTYRWTCTWQNKVLGAGTGDGKVGQKTIAKMKEYGSYSDEQDAPVQSTPVETPVQDRGKYTGEYPAPKKYLEYKDKGTEVKKLQEYLNWYTNGEFFKKCGSADGVYGKNTLKYTKKMQTDFFGASEADGKVGAKTIAKMKEVGGYTPAPTDYTLMIDVSEFQSSINWKKVKADGVKGVIVRCGGRGGKSGEIYDDIKYMEYIKGAHAVGLPVGIYFLTSAINAQEGKAEAEYTIKRWKEAGVPISYPICIDSENIFWYEIKNGKKVRCSGRANSDVLPEAKRTEAIKAFGEECKRQGYFSMIYASTGWLKDDVNMSKLSFMDVWCAQYYKECQYSGKYIIWQYTSTGKVNGIPDVVDFDRCYIKPNPIYPSTPQPTPTPIPTPVPEPTPVSGGYTGAYPTASQIKKASHTGMIQRGFIWANRVAKDKKIHYVKFATSSKCQMCLNKIVWDGKQFVVKCSPEVAGWQCIGTAAAFLHHGMGAPTTCWPGVVAQGKNGHLDLYDAKTDAEALKMAQKKFGTKDIELIRNKNGIPKSQWKPGDYCCMFKNGNEFQHAFIAAENNQVFDATQAGGIGSVNNIKFRSNRNYSCKVIIRYTGGLSYLQKYDRGEAVTALQNYLNWYTNGQFFKECGEADGIFGENTLKYVKKMQSDFFGASEADGLVGQKTINKMKEYSQSFKLAPTPTLTPIPSGSSYSGEIPTLRLVKTNSQVIADTVAWAKWIAGDNRFHYGYGEHAHHNGCYFCGTQKLKKNHGIVDPEFTYCCNAFVGAAWAHGGRVPKAISLCQNCSSWDFGKGQGYDASNLFDKLGHPAKSKLKIGDVLCRDTHVALYIGDGKIVEASGGDDNKKNSDSWNKSIRIATLTDAKYKKFTRVYRFNSSVNADIIMRHGEVSDRVMQWQKFLDWYFDGEFFKECGGADKYFGDNTLKWTKKFQEREFGAQEADGLCGDKTFSRAKEIIK